MLRRKPTIYHPSDIIYSLIRLLPHLIKKWEVSTSSESFISPKEEYDGCSLDYEIKWVLDNYQSKIFIPVAWRDGAYAVYNFNWNSFLLSAGIQKVLIWKILNHVNLLLEIIYYEIDI